MTTSRNKRHSTLMPLVLHLNTGSIMLLAVMLSIHLFACLSVCLPVHHISICHLTSRVRSISPSPVKAFLEFPDSRYAEFIVFTKSVTERRGHTLSTRHGETNCREKEL